MKAYAGSNPALSTISFPAKSNHASPAGKPRLLSGSADQNERKASLPDHPFRCKSARKSGGNIMGRSTISRRAALSALILLAASLLCWAVVIEETLRR